MKNVKCPNCGSMAIKKSNPLWMIGFTLLVATGVLMWIPLIGWVCVPVCFILGVLILILAPFNKEVKCICNTCKYEWIETKTKNK